MAGKSQTDSQKAEMISCCRMFSGAWKADVADTWPRWCLHFSMLCLGLAFLCVYPHMPLGLIVSHTLGAVSSAAEFHSLLSHTLLKFDQ